MGNWTLQHLNKNVLIKMLEEKENNWNELKDWIKENERYFDSYSLDYVIDKMQEIESRK